MDLAADNPDWDQFITMYCGRMPTGKSQRAMFERDLELMNISRAVFSYLRNDKMIGAFKPILNTNTFFLILPKIVILYRPTNKSNSSYQHKRETGRRSSSSVQPRPPTKSRSCEHHMREMAVPGEITIEAASSETHSPLVFTIRPNFWNLSTCVSFCIFIWGQVNGTHRTNQQTHISHRDSLSLL
jgi:hypothetical protein